MNGWQNKIQELISKKIDHFFIDSESERNHVLACARRMRVKIATRKWFDGKIKVWKVNSFG